MKRTSTTIDGNNLKILVCCHKPCELPPDDAAVFLPIHVGAAISDIDLGMQRDDEANHLPCDNISAKNKSFCELTALYWAWKNIKTLYPDLQYIGLNHYRRYFSFDKTDFLRFEIIENEKAIKNYHFDLARTQSLLAKYDAIVSIPKTLPYSVEFQYCIAHISEDLRRMTDILHEKCPQYDQAVQDIIIKGNKLIPFNMCILRWDDFDAYCTWLFDVLAEAERRIDISNYSELQARVFGYLSERLLNVWLAHNKLRVRRLSVLRFSDEDICGRGFVRSIFANVANLASMLVCNATARILRFKHSGMRGKIGL